MQSSFLTFDLQIFYPFLIHLTAIFLGRDVPSRAALSVIRPAIGKQQIISDKAKAAMQGYLNHFLGNLDIINSREVKSENYINFLHSI